MDCFWAEPKRKRGIAFVNRLWKVPRTFRKGGNCVSKHRILEVRKDPLSGTKQPQSHKKGKSRPLNPSSVPTGEKGL